MRELVSRQMYDEFGAQALENVWNHYFLDWYDNVSADTIDDFDYQKIALPKLVQAQKRIIPRRKLPFQLYQLRKWYDVTVI